MILYNNVLKFTQYLHFTHVTKYEHMHQLLYIYFHHSRTTHYTFSTKVNKKIHMQLYMIGNKTYKLFLQQNIGFSRDLLTTTKFLYKRAYELTNIFMLTLFKTTCILRNIVSWILYNYGL